MFDYVYQWSLSTITKSILFIFLNISCLYLHDIDLKKEVSLQTIFKLRHTYQTKRLLRVIYFREFDMTVNENRLKIDVKNLTESYGIDLKLNILNQSTSLLTKKLCSLISEEPRDTILIADLYTKEIDLISRSLQIPTIAITNRYSIVQGKLVKFEILFTKNSNLFFLL
jgi:hypothetical protein